MLALLVGNVNAQTNVRVLNASDTICTGSGVCLNWTDSVAAVPSQCKGGGFWDQTYGNTAGFNIGSFKLTHNSGFDIYSYWGGFTSGSNGDNLCYTTNCLSNLSPCAQPGSNGWIQNQWGVMAGGGLSSTSPVTVIKGVPYLIAYWDYFSDGSFDYDAQSVTISLNGDSLFKPQEVYICNHPWPYYGNIYGDGFAHKFDNDTCLFYLKITSFDASGNKVDSVFDTLAKGSSSLQGPIQSPDWHMVDLSDIGTNIRKLVFTMYSTDRLIYNDIDYGPNTAVYFNLDKLRVTKTGRVAASPAITRKTETAAPKAVEVKDNFPIPSYTGGEVTVFDTKGKEVLKTTVKAGEKINLSKLPKGEYRLRHGHRHIPVIKK
jgi:hypothetical protein